MAHLTLHAHPQGWFIPHSMLSGRVHLTLNGAERLISHCAGLVTSCVPQGSATEEERETLQEIRDHALETGKTLEVKTTLEPARPLRYRKPPERPVSVGS